MAPSASELFENVSRKHTQLSELYHRHADSAGDPAQQEQIRDQITMLEQQVLVMREDLMAYFDHNQVTPGTPAPEPEKPIETGPTPDDPQPPTKDTKGSGSFYVNPNSIAAKQVGDYGVADQSFIELLAARSVGFWWTGGDLDEIRTGLNNAAQRNQNFVLVAYLVPGRDNGGYSKGGETDFDAYKAKIDQLVEAIEQNWHNANHPTGAAFTAQLFIINEPDAVNLPDSLDKTRKDCLSYSAHAFATLHQKGNAQAYIDAGHSNWRSPTDVANRIKSIDIPESTGIFSNVSSFQPTESEMAYDAEIASQTGGRTWVIDTSRNGLGMKQSEWCNPSNVLAGVQSTEQTGNEFCDALLWIKPPGESDGNCNGGPNAGEWFGSWALNFARRSVDAGRL